MVCYQSSTGLENENKCIWGQCRADQGHVGRPERGLLLMEGYINRSFGEAGLAVKQ